MNTVFLKGWITNLNIISGDKSNNQYAKFGLGYSKKLNNNQYKTVYIQATCFQTFLIEKIKNKEIKSNMQVVVEAKLSAYQSEKHDNVYLNTLIIKNITVLNYQNKMTNVNNFDAINDSQTQNKRVEQY